MAGEKEGAAEKERRSAASTVATLFLLLIVLGLAAGWGYFGVYQLDPGQAAIVQRFGKVQYTETREGLRWHLPPPIESHEILLVDSIVREEFGAGGAEGSEALSEATMQTKGNNIVNLEFILQYRIGNAFNARYQLADLRETLRNAAQAAVREVVGRTTIDEVLADRRAAVEAESTELLQASLDAYEAGLFVISIQLQEVKPPQAVRAAFDDVIAAAQDRDRKVNEAQGYANEVLPRARAEATEFLQSAQAYAQEKVAKADGESQRFVALVEEYKRAPEVTRNRLYLEAMEEVLTEVELVVMEPGGSPIMPYLPLGQKRGAGQSRTEAQKDAENNSP